MALLFCLGTFCSRQTCAQTPSFVDLKDEPDACVQRAELEASIVRELGAIEVPMGLRVEVQLGDSVGFLLKDDGEVAAERHFDSVPSDCATAMKMLSVVIAMAIEHKLANEKDAQESTVASPVVAAPPQREPTPPGDKNLTDPKSTKSKGEPEETSASKAKEKTWGLRGSAGVGYSFGVIPVPAPLITADAGVVVWRGWSVGLGLLVTDRMRIGFDIDKPETGSTPDEAFSQAIGQLFAGKIQGCWERVFEGGGLGFCGGLAAGTFHARGVEGFQPNPGQGVPWLAGFARMTGRAPARGPFGVSLNADIFANFLRPGVELTGEGSAKSPMDTPVAGGAATLGMFFILM